MKKCFLHNEKGYAYPALKRTKFHPLKTILLFQDSDSDREHAYIDQVLSSNHLRKPWILFSECLKLTNYTFNLCFNGLITQLQGTFHHRHNPPQTHNYKQPLLSSSKMIPKAMPQQQLRHQLHSLAVYRRHCQAAQLKATDSAESSDRIEIPNQWYLAFSMLTLFLDEQKSKVEDSSRMVRIRSKRSNDIAIIRSWVDSRNLAKWFFSRVLCLINETCSDLGFTKMLPFLPPVQAFDEVLDWYFNRFNGDRLMRGTIGAISWVHLLEF